MKYKIILKETGQTLVEYDDSEPNFVAIGYDEETCERVAINEEEEAIQLPLIFLHLFNKHIRLRRASKLILKLISFYHLLKSFIIVNIADNLDIDILIELVISPTTV